jgi:hypothetical protein
VASWRLRDDDGPTADLVANALLAIAYELRTSNMIRYAETFGSGFGDLGMIEDRLEDTPDTPVT